MISSLTHLLEISMTMTLNRIYNGELLWETDTYEVRLADGGVGYHLVNTNTGAIEGYTDQEPAAVMTALMLQEHYNETMADPLREFKVRQQKRAMREGFEAGPKLVN